MLCRDWDDGCVLTPGVFHELFDLFVVLDGLFLVLEDDINFVLKNDHVIKFHDFECNQMLGSLWLGAINISGYKEECSIHYGSTCEHGREKNIMSWAITK